MPGAGRLGDRASCPADAHGCPACPHAVSGPAIAGAPNVCINGRPALRVGDAGLHAACCAGNRWEALTGSATVFINGHPAHRLGDAVRHCGGVGRLIEGSGDVSFGDVAVRGVARPGGLPPSAATAKSPAAASRGPNHIEIRVLEEGEGIPIPGLHVFYRRRGAPRRWLGAHKTDEHGRTVLTHLAEGVFDLWIRGRGYAERLRGVRSEPGDGEVQAARLKNSQPARSAVRVTVKEETTQHGMSGVTLRLVKLLRRGHGGRVKRERETGAGGVAEFAKLAPGTYRVEVVAPRHSYAFGKPKKIVVE